MPSLVSLTNTPAVITVCGNSATISATTSGSTRRGLRGQNTNPSAVAPCSTACCASSIRVMPQTLRNTDTPLSDRGADLAEAFGIGGSRPRRRTRQGSPHVLCHQSPDRCRGIAVRHEPFADQERSITSGRELFQVRARLETAFADRADIRGDLSGQPIRGLHVHRQRPEISVVHANQPRTAVQCPCELFFVVNLDERGEPELCGALL